MTSKKVMSKNGINEGTEKKISEKREIKRNVHSFLLIKERIVNKHSVK